MNEYNNGYPFSGINSTTTETFKNTDEEVIENTMPVIKEGDEVVDLGEDFDFSGFQVVRREFFAHTREPSITFNNCKFYVNAACLAKFPNTDFAQVLINKDDKILALRPCPEGARDSFRWCYFSKGKRKPKHITCRLFFAKVASMMGWNPIYKYKLLGKLIHSNEEYLIAFDLTASETYRKTVAEDEKLKTSRVPVYPADWQNQFGLPYNEHKQSMQVNIVDGYAVYSIKDTSRKNTLDEQPKIIPKAATIDSITSRFGGGSND